MEVINDLLNYNNLKIYQNTDWFSFSLDSVLLPNFIEQKANYKMILDLCTGNAPIPLILSTRMKGKIYGVELQKDIYDLAIKSVNINNLQERIEIINSDIKEIRSLFPSDYFDLITCNPPYFKEETNNKKNQVIQKTIARHEICIKLEEIIKIAKALLKNNGSFVLIHRTERFIEIITKMRENNIEPKRICFIHPKKGKDSNMFLVEGRKNGKPGLKVVRPIYTQNKDGNYSDEVLEMFH